MTRINNDTSNIENDNFMEDTKDCNFEFNVNLIFLLFLKMALIDAILMILNYKKIKIN